MDLLGFKSSSVWITFQTEPVYNPSFIDLIITFHSEFWFWVLVPVGLYGSMVIRQYRDMAIIWRYGRRWGFLLGGGGLFVPTVPNGGTKSIVKTLWAKVLLLYLCFVPRSSLSTKSNTKSVFIFQNRKNVFQPVFEWNKTSKMKAVRFVALPSWQ